jgi:hypothetical protein
VVVTNINEDETGRWRQAIDALAASLAAHLGHEVTVDRRTEMENGFFCAIRGPEPSGPTLQIAWEGSFAMEQVDGEPEVSATLLLFSRGRRLRLDNQSGSYLVLDYEGALDGSGTWKDRGWLADDLGEFEAYDQYGD